MCSCASGSGTCNVASLRSAFTSIYFMLLMNICCYNILFVGYAIMCSRAARLFRGLEGLFAVYKPPGVHWKLVRDSIETHLLKARRRWIVSLGDGRNILSSTHSILGRTLSSSVVGLNSGTPLEQKRQVRFLPESGEGCGGSTELTLTATHLPVLASHPLVTGPQFRKLRVGVGHQLDSFSSGVLVLGVGQGNQMFADLDNSWTTRDYIVEGKLGLAAEDFSHTGRIVERTTYDHISQDDLERVLAMIQGTHQKALIMYSNVDLCSQQAYELAVKGSLYPQGKSPPILTALRCLHFKPPYFTLEMQCVNESQRFLRRVVHEVGLELRSTAVCTGVRRTRDGPFTLQAALTHRHWTLHKIREAVQQSRLALRQRIPQELQLQNTGTC